MNNNRGIAISVGSSRKSQQWSTQNTTWGEFVAKLGAPQRTAESLAEYKSLTVAQQAALKDIGGFVGGVLKGPRRKNEFAGDRDLITLDADSIQAGATQAVINAVAALGCSYCIYSTRKHAPDAPRLRIVVPLDAPCSPEEYEPIARRLASYIGIHIMDPTTFEPVRLMYWPSCSRDSEYVYLWEDKPFLSKTGMLGTYKDWKDVTEWPEVPGAAKIRERSEKKQGDPLTKSGVVGAFCKVFSITDAIAQFLSDVYVPAEGGRYTYCGGTTVAGAVIYDNKFLYSHHSTDPCSGKLVNAFDLVRIHLFGDEDVDAAVDTPTTRLKSWESMLKFASNIEQVRLLNMQETFSKPVLDATAPATTEVQKVDKNWYAELDYNETGNVISTISNARLILANDEDFKAGGVYKDIFYDKAIISGKFPWSSRKGPRTWDDTDDSGLREFLQKKYHIKGKELIQDALNRYLEDHSRHCVQEYLATLVWDQIPRVDTLFIDYLGADDSEYHRNVARIFLCAAVARQYQPGVKFDYMPVLFGRQGIGKSTLVNKLAGKWYSDSLSMLEMRDKSGAEKLQGYMVIEVGELAGMYRSDMESVKSFLSRTTDVFRPVYGRCTVERPRQCVFIGTTNEFEFLKDQTGNRRFWPVEVGQHAPTKDIFTIDRYTIDQIWAEALYRYAVIGQPLYLSNDLLQVAINKQEAHTEADPRTGTITDFLDRAITSDWYNQTKDQRRAMMRSNINIEQGYRRDKICVAEILNECFGMDDGKADKKLANEISKIMAAVPGWKRYDGSLRFGSGYGVQRGFIREINE